MPWQTRKLQNRTENIKEKLNTKTRLHIETKEGKIKVKKDTHARTRARTHTQTHTYRFMI